MSSRIFYRFLILFLTPFAILFSVIYISSSSNDATSYTVNPTAVHVHVDPASWKTKKTSVNPTVKEFLTTTTTATTLTTTKKCEVFNIPDTRPFFEREPPQTNLPRLASESSRQNLRQRLRSLRLVVVACAFNVENDVQKFREHVEPIIDLFHPSSKILILESDSTDRTLEKLRQWSRPQLFTYGNLTIPIPRRTERIAYCRNELLRRARDLKPDYMLTLDLDIFATNVSSFLSNFDWDSDEWSVMTANLVKDYYYDIWALRTMSETIINYDCWHRIWALVHMDRYCVDTIINNVVDIHKKPYPLERGLLEVRSAFGGAGLYKMSHTEGCEYSGDYYTCEHVPFHICMREKHNARIFINPKFTQ